MKLFLKNFYQVLLIFLITLIYLFLFEILLRGSLYFITKNKSFFQYGFKKGVIIEVVDLSEFKFNFENLNLVNKIKKEPETQIESNNFTSKKIVWVFGASFTHGFACGKSSSSWPDELQKINSNLKVVNFGFPSTYSNDSIKLLKFNLNNKQLVNPDYILWAHRDEEKLAIPRGLGEHKDQIKKKFSFDMKNNSFYLMRIEKTFETNSIFYLLTKHIVKKLKKRFNIPINNKSSKEITEEDYKIILNNFELNTKEAINVSYNKKVKKFFILNLFSDDQFTKENQSFFLNHFDKISKEITIEENANYINLFEYLNLSQKDKFKDFYCENKHYTLIGNQVIAKILDQNIF